MWRALSDSLVNHEKAECIRLDLVPRKRQDDEHATCVIVTLATYLNIK